METSQVSIFWILLNILVHIFVSIILWNLLKMSVLHYRSPFVWHVIFCTIGFIFLMAEAFLVYTAGSIWTLSLSTYSQQILHWVFLRGGIFLCIVGIAIEIEYKTKRGKRHFTTYHGKTGIVSMVLLCISTVGVICVIYADSLCPHWKSLIVFVHDIIVTSGFAIGMISYVLGYYTGWFNKFASLTTRRFLITITIFISIVCIVSYFNVVYNKYLSATSS